MKGNVMKPMGAGIEELQHGHPPERKTTFFWIQQGYHSSTTAPELGKFFEKNVAWEKLWAENRRTAKSSKTFGKNYWLRVFFGKILPACG